MSEDNRWYSNGHEEYIPPGFRQSRQVSSPIQIPSSTAQKQRRRSPSPHSSIASGSYSDDRSHASFASASTAPSTAPSLNPLAPMNPINYGYEYPCEFGFADCSLRFHPTQIDAWISHEASHFLEHRPPPKTCCIFCDLVFENFADPHLSWRQRMAHIAVHFQNRARQEDVRPDFFILDYMRKKRILSAEDYKWAIRHTERPPCDGLVDIGYKTPEMKRKEEKSRELRHNLEKEDRQRRRERDSKGKGKGTRR